MLSEKYYHWNAILIMFKFSKEKCCTKSFSLIVLQGKYCTESVTLEVLHWEYYTGIVPQRLLHWLYCTESIALRIWTSHIILKLFQQLRFIFPGWYFVPNSNYYIERRRYRAIKFRLTRSLGRYAPLFIAPEMATVIWDYLGTLGSHRS